MTTYAIDTKRIINHYFMENYNENKTLTINYTTGTGRGCFTINNMIDFFPVAAGKFKIIIDLLKKAENPAEPAEVLYHFLKTCADHLTGIRDRCEPINDQEKRSRAELTNAIKKYNANIEALCKVFNFAPAEDREAVKMKKTTVAALKYDSARGGYCVENHEGKKFIKGGVIFHAYKIKKQVYIILPCCGLSCAKYEGAITTAPEYITPDLLEKIKTWDFTEPAARFKEVLNGAENIILNDDINALPVAEAETTPATAPAETTTTAPAEVDNATPETPAAEPANKTPDTAPAEEATEPAPDITPDPDINNAINIIDNNFKYTIIADPHGHYNIIAQQVEPFKMFSIRIDNAGGVQVYSITTATYNKLYYKDKYFNNDNVKLLLELYYKLNACGLLPDYLPSATTAANIKQIYNRHITPRQAAPLYYTFIYYKLLTSARTAAGTAKKAHTGKYNAGAIKAPKRPKNGPNGRQDIKTRQDQKTPPGTRTGAGYGVIIKAAALYARQARTPAKNAPLYYNTS